MIKYTKTDFIISCCVIILTIFNVLITPVDSYAIEKEKLDGQADKILLLIKKEKFRQVEDIINYSISNTSEKKVFYNGKDYFLSLIDRWIYFPDETPKDLLPYLNKWILSSPENFIPYTIKGNYHISLGWQVRGTGFAEDISDDVWTEYRELLELARVDLETALELSPTDLVAGVSLLTTLRSIAHIKDFETIYQMIMAKDPYYFPAYIEKLENLKPKWSGSWEQMFDYAKKSTLNAPKNSYIPMLILFAHKEAADNSDEGAIEYYSTPEIWEEVNKAYKRILDNFPDETVASYYFAEMASSAQKDIEAEEAYNFIEKIAPNNARLYTKRGQHFSYRGNWTKVEDNYRKWVELKPNDETALSELAFALSAENKYEEAIETIKKAIAISPKSISHLNMLCHSYYAFGKYEQTIKSCTKVTTLDSEEAFPYQIMAMAYEALGNTEKKIANQKKYDELTSSEPSNINFDFDFSFDVDGFGSSDYIMYILGGIIVIFFIFLMLSKLNRPAKTNDKYEFENFDFGDNDSNKDSLNTPFDTNSSDIPTATFPSEIAEAKNILSTEESSEPMNQETTLLKNANLGPVPTRRETAARKVTSTMAIAPSEPITSSAFSPENNSSESDSSNNRVVYNGTTGELYKIWFVNLLLSIVTLGINRFWGKVRIRKYITSNSSLLNDRFEYIGTGGELFKSFLKALPIIIPLYFVVYFVINKLEEATLAKDEAAISMAAMQLMGVYLVFIFFIFVGIYSGMRYKLSRTTWRGVKAGLRGGAMIYATMKIFYFFLNIITLGLLIPRNDNKIEEYVMNNLCFGSEKMMFRGKSSELFKVNIVTLVLYLPTLSLSRIWYKSAFSRYRLRHLVIGDIRFEGTHTGKDRLWLTIGNVFIITLTLGIGLPIVIQRNVTFHVKNTYIIGDINTSSILQNNDELKAGEGLADAFDVDMGFM